MNTPSAFRRFLALLLLTLVIATETALARSFEPPEVKGYHDGGQLSTSTSSEDLLLAVTSGYPRQAETSLRESETSTNQIASNIIVEEVPSRSKRQVEAGQCPYAVGIPDSQVSLLRSCMNATTLLGLDPNDTDTISVKASQPRHCPQSLGSIGNESNARALCPWRNDRVDLGANFSPRYVVNATCLCRYCVAMDTLSCVPLATLTTVFERTATKDGLALMVKTKVTIVHGCYCQRPTVQSF